MAVVLIVEFLPNELPSTFDARFELLDSEQKPVILGAGPLLIGGQGRAESNEFHDEGEPTSVPLVMNIGAGIQLDLGTYYFRGTMTLIESNQTVSELVRFRVREVLQPLPSQEETSAGQ
ncbi:hypothetical protein [Mycobacterium avium]|uniref:hypothetical protein n=1 Tax=Mycobacterium avium TaxID=1764 RepID=UPI001CC68FBD|nr:hypothetical protein [Mycobacterium avium]MBZ4618834.1 hypothetical protein [Mycobacterium avium subsp. hominissuis]